MWRRTTGVLVLKSKICSELLSLFLHDLIMSKKGFEEKSAIKCWSFEGLILRKHLNFDRTLFSFLDEKRRKIKRNVTCTKRI